MSSGAPTILPAQWIQTIAQQLPIAQAGITQAGGEADNTHIACGCKGSCTMLKLAVRLM